MRGIGEMTARLVMVDDPLTVELWRTARNSNGNSGVAGRSDR